MKPSGKGGSILYPVRVSDTRHNCQGQSHETKHSNDCRRKILSFPYYTLIHKPCIGHLCQSCKYPQRIMRGQQASRRCKYVQALYARSTSILAMSVCTGTVPQANKYLSPFRAKYCYTRSVIHQSELSHHVPSTPNPFGQATCRQQPRKGRHAIAVQCL